MLAIGVLLLQGCQTIKAVTEFQSNVNYVNGMEAIKNKNGSKAVEELSKVASRNDEVSFSAKLALADIYFEGEIRPKNLKKAQKLYEELSEQNTDIISKKFANSKLGLIFYEGIGVEVSSVKSAKYFIQSLKENEKIEDNFYLKNLLKKPEVYVEIFKNKFVQSTICNIVNNSENKSQNMKPCFGIQIQNTNKNDTPLTKRYSVNVISIFKDTPAYKSDLRVNDFITRIDGGLINNTSDFFSAINHKNPGQLSNITILRDGNYIDKEIRLGYQKEFNLKPGFLLIEEKKFNEAFVFFEKLASFGHPTAQRVLGALYFEGKGIKKNKKTGLGWTYIAAKNGDVLSQTRLGFEYYNGENTGIDLKKSVSWHKLAIKSGSSVSKNDLALIYMNKELINSYFPDLDFNFVSKYAYELIKSIVKENKPIYLFNLALMYKDGIGTEVDLNKAKFYFQKAATLGDKKSVEQLKLLGDLNSNYELVTLEKNKKNNNLNQR